MKSTITNIIFKNTKTISLFLILLSLNSFGQTTIQDETDINGTWTVANSPYIIEGRTVVPNGQTLTIEPGVEVRLSSSASPTPSWFDYSEGNVGVIRVQGEIIANGTPEEPILFTRDNSGFWGTILIDENASGTSSFSSCIIEYAKESRNVTGITSPSAFNAGISIFNKSITFNDNILRDNINGAYIKNVGANASFNFNNNTFFNNGTNGLVIEESTVNITNNTFYNNSNSASGSVSAIHSSNSDVYLVGNLIYNNDDFGIYTRNFGNHYLVNNTIYGNDQGIRVESGANTFIYNCIVQDNGLNFATSNPVGAIIEMQHSLTNDVDFPDNVTDATENVLNADALFTDPAADDFSLLETSPAIDLGNPDSSNLNIPTLDILGNPRFDSDIIDLGAIEFQQTLSIDVVNNFASLKVYPNPTEDFIYVVSDEETSAKIHTINGRFIANYTSNVIDIKHLNQGIYILTIENSLGQKTTRKIIKQ